MPKRIFSEKVDLVIKSREAALSAVQVFNNPLTTFKTETFIVLFMISWTYLLHAYYRGKKIEYRYHSVINKRKKFDYNTDGSIKYWDLTQCLSCPECPLDLHTVNNLKFLIGLRNQIEHKKVNRLDSYLSARYQACALNYNFYLKKLHYEKYGLDELMALSIQFAELDYEQAKIMKDKDDLIPSQVRSYIAAFDSDLTEDQRQHERYAYRLVFTKVLAKRPGQADRLIEFIDPGSPLAETIQKEYWVKDEKEKPKFLPSQVVREIKKAGFTSFSVPKHTDLWKLHDAKNPSKGFGTLVADKAWHWYQNWIDYLINELRKETNQ